MIQSCTIAGTMIVSLKDCNMKVIFEKTLNIILYMWGVVLLGTMVYAVYATIKNIAEGNLIR